MSQQKNVTPFVVSANVLLWRKNKMIIKKLYMRIAKHS